MSRTVDSMITFSNNDDTATGMAVIVGDSIRAMVVDREGNVHNYCNVCKRDMVTIQNLSSNKRLGTVSYTAKKCPHYSVDRYQAYLFADSS